MPRDKSATHAKLIPIIRNEFIEFGYEKASLQHIASQAGITAAGLYRHYENKEEMFASLVDETVTAFLQFWDDALAGALALSKEPDFEGDFMDYRNKINNSLVDFMYNHYEDLKLALMKSRGTRYEHLEAELIKKEDDAIRIMLELFERKHIPHNKLTANEIHILSTTFIIGLTEAVKHDYSKEEVQQHLLFVARFLIPGFREIIGF